MSQDELHWLAFRYLTGEMTDPEQEAFEQRLGEEQEAREALAQAVALYQALAGLEAGPAVMPRRDIRRPATWAAVVAACSLLAFAIYALIPSRGRVDNPADQANGGDQAVAALVSAWTEVRHAQDEEPALAEPAEVPPAPGIDLIETSAPIPNWLMTAVAAESKRPKEKK